MSVPDFPLGIQSRNRPPTCLRNSFSRSLTEELCLDRVQNYLGDISLFHFRAVIRTTPPIGGVLKIMKSLKTFVRL